MTELQTKTPNTSFRELPEPVRGWLASTQITYLISDLNRRLGFSEEEKTDVIPTLILRLAVSSVTPEDFISELSKLLEISPSGAKTLAQEIEEKMLRPIELVLRNELGIDIKLIHLGKELAPMRQTSSAPSPVLIPSPEIAHPDEKVVPQTSQLKPFQSPVYAPSSQAPVARPLPKIEPLQTAQSSMNRPTLVPPSRPSVPKIEPLPKPMPQQVQSTPIPVRIMPSKVPNFLKPEDFQN